MCNINCLSKQMKCVLRKWSFLIPAPSHRYTLSTIVKSQWRAASWDYGMQDVCLYKGNERCLNKAIQNYTEETWSSLLCHSFVAWDETALRSKGDNMQREREGETPKMKHKAELQITSVWNRSRLCFFLFSQHYWIWKTKIKSLLTETRYWRQRSQESFSHRHFKRQGWTRINVADIWLNFLFF